MHKMRIRKSYVLMIFNNFIRCLIAALRESTNKHGMAWWKREMNRWTTWTWQRYRPMRATTAFDIIANQVQVKEKPLLRQQPTEMKEMEEEKEEEDWHYGAEMKREVRGKRGNGSRNNRRQRKEKRVKTKITHHFSISRVFIQNHDLWQRRGAILWLIISS